jgi:hypothetical protein
MTLFDYLQLNIGVNLNPVNLEPYTPVPTKLEITNGEIVRYFARFATHVNTDDIVEISQQTYQSILSNKLYTKVSIRWKIRGSLEDEVGLTTEGDPITLYKGVITSNRDSVLLADETMPGIRFNINDFQRFWQGL